MYRKIKISLLPCAFLVAADQYMSSIYVCSMIRHCWMDSSVCLVTHDLWLLLEKSYSVNINQTVKLSCACPENLFPLKTESELCKSYSSSFSKSYFWTKEWAEQCLQHILNTRSNALMYKVHYFEVWFWTVPVNVEVLNHVGKFVPLFHVDSKVPLCLWRFYSCIKWE